MDSRQEESLSGYGMSFWQCAGCYYCGAPSAPLAVRGTNTRRFPSYSQVLSSVRKARRYRPRRPSFQPGTATVPGPSPSFGRRCGVSRRVSGGEISPLVQPISAEPSPGGRSRVRSRHSIGSPSNRGSPVGRARRIKPSAAGSQGLDQPRRHAVALRFLLAPLDDSAWLEKFRCEQGRRPLGEAGAGQDVFRRGGACRYRRAWRHELRCRAEGALGPSAYLAEPIGATRSVSPGAAAGRERVGTGAVGASGGLTPRPSRMGACFLGWAAVPDDKRQMVTRPVVEQLLPVTSDGERGFRVPDDPRQRVPQRGHNPARELAALFWRRWLDTAKLPVFPARELVPPTSPT